MLIFIGLIAALGGFAVMSRPFKIGFALYVGYLIYYIYIYGGGEDL